MSESSEKRMITTAALCRRLGVCRQTLYRWLEAGQIEADRTPGGHYRFEADVKPRRAMKSTNAG